MRSGGWLFLPWCILAVWHRDDGAISSLSVLEERNQPEKREDVECEHLEVVVGQLTKLRWNAQARSLSLR